MSRASARIIAAAVLVFAPVFALVFAGFAAAAEPPSHLYRQHCADCHGADRLGGMGPALLPENLGRLKPEKAKQVIAAGRPYTQMPGFSSDLDARQIDALVDHIYTPLPEKPEWGLAEIEASREVSLAPEQLVDGPVFAADPLNLFVVVEAGDHHVTILDGDNFEPLTRFPSRFALHGGPKFSPDGRFVYFGSRDGWVTKYDLYGLAIVAEVRAGINTRNIALSHDGRVLAVANYLPHSLVLLSAADLRPIQIIPTLDLQKKHSSRVSAVYQAAPRSSFVVALKDIPELWEISYAEHSSAGFSDRFPIRRIPLSQPLDDFFFTPSYREVMGSARDGANSVVVNLDVGREIATLPLPGLPHLGSGISWVRDGRRVMATPHLKGGLVSIVDMEDWKVIRTIETLGPGFFMRSHESSPYAWVDVFFGPNRDAVHVIDKQSLKIVKTLRPEPGKTAAHVEFTRDGRYALLSIWDMDGAIIVYDAKTLEQVKRLPFVKPSGKYNVYNKIHLSEGTSH